MRKPNKSFAAGCSLGLLVGIAIPFIVALLSGLLFPSYFVAKTESRLKPPPVTAGYHADYNWTLSDLNDQPVPFDSFKDKAVFLHFWNPKCMNCLAEIPSINRLYNEAGVYGVEFVAVAVGAVGDDLAGIVAREGILTPVYTVEGNLPPVFQATGTPATYVVAPDGDVVFMHVGGAKWDDVRVGFLLKQLTQESSGTSSDATESP